MIPNRPASSRATLTSQRTAKRRELVAGARKAREQSSLAREESTIPQEFEEKAITSVAGDPLREMDTNLTPEGIERERFLVLRGKDNLTSAVRMAMLDMSRWKTSADAVWRQNPPSYLENLAETDVVLSHTAAGVLPTEEPATKFQRTKLAKAVAKYKKELSPKARLFGVKAAGGFLPPEQLTMYTLTPQRFSPEVNRLMRLLWNAEFVRGPGEKSPPARAMTELAKAGGVPEKLAETIGEDYVESWKRTFWSEIAGQHRLDAPWDVYRKGADPIVIDPMKVWDESGGGPNYHLVPTPKEFTDSLKDLNRLTPYMEKRGVLPADFVSRQLEMYSGMDSGEVPRGMQVSPDVVKRWKSFAAGEEDFSSLEKTLSEIVNETMEKPDASRWMINKSVVAPDGSTKLVPNEEAAFAVMYDNFSVMFPEVSGLDISIRNNRYRNRVIAKTLRYAEELTDLAEDAPGSRVAEIAEKLEASSGTKLSETVVSDVSRDRRFRPGVEGKLPPYATEIPEDVADLLGVKYMVEGGMPVAQRKRLEQAMTAFYNESEASRAMTHLFYRSLLDTLRQTQEEGARAPSVVRLAENIRRHSKYHFDAFPVIPRNTRSNFTNQQRFIADGIREIHRLIGTVPQAGRSKFPFPSEKDLTEVYQTLTGGVDPYG